MGAEEPRRHEIHRPPEQSGQVVLKRDERKPGGRVRPEFDEHVEVAAGPIFAPQHRPEDGEPADPIALAQEIQSAAVEEEIRNRAHDLILASGRQARAPRPPQVCRSAGSTFSRIVSVVSSYRFRPSLKSCFFAW